MTLVPIGTLRHHLVVLQRHVGPRTVTFTPADRAFLAALPPSAATVADVATAWGAAVGCPMRRFIASERRSQWVPVEMVIPRSRR
jgi:hypothetical protein